PAAAMRPDLEHGVLHHVLRVGRVADDPQRDGIGAIDMAFDEQAERGFVTARKAVEQLRILVKDDLGADRLAVGYGRDRLRPGDDRLRSLAGHPRGLGADIKRVTHPSISSPTCRWRTIHAAFEA